jgi:2-oxo-4-hydroxy-4-carboxy-5-ureidoimidazoline decarboxylase
VLLDLDTQYREKFGFPFNFAVRGSSKNHILVALNIRPDSSAEEEFSQARWEVHRIAAFSTRIGIVIRDCRFIVLRRVLTVL